MFNIMVYSSEIHTLKIQRIGNHTMYRKGMSELLKRDNGFYYQSFLFLSVFYYHTATCILDEHKEPTPFNSEL